MFLLQNGIDTGKVRIISFCEDVFEKSQLGFSFIQTLKREKEKERKRRRDIGGGRERGRKENKEMERKKAKESKKNKERKQESKQARKKRSCVENYITNLWQSVRITWESNDAQFYGMTRNKDFQQG